MSGFADVLDDWTPILSYDFSQYSSNTVPERNGGPSLTVDSGASLGSGLFPGAGQALTLPAGCKARNTGAVSPAWDTDELTFEYVYSVPTSAVSATMYIDTAAASGGLLSLRIPDDVYVISPQATAGNASSRSGSGVISTNTPYIVQAVFKVSTNEYKIYINGSLVSNTGSGFTGSGNMKSTGGYGVYVNCRDSNDLSNGMTVNYMSIYTHAMTSGESAARYALINSAPANPATTSLDSASVSYVGDPRTDWVLDFELSANQADCTFEYQLDEGSWTACDATDSITGSDFVEHSIIFRSTNPDDDIESPGTDPYVFTPDNVKPSISVDSFVVTPPVSPDVETTIDFELSSDDEDAIFEYNFNEIGWVTCSATDSYTDELVPATYTMYFHAIDDSGYISEQAYQTFTVEATDTDTYYPNYRRRQQQTRVRWS